MERGVRVPDFVLKSEGQPTRYYACAGGHPSVLAVLRGDDAPEALEALDGLARAGAELTLVGPPELWRAHSERLSVKAHRVFEDEEGQVGRALGGQGGRSVLLALSANLRVLEHLDVPLRAAATASPLEAGDAPSGDGTQHRDITERLLAALRRGGWRPQGEPTASVDVVRHQAPVLYVPEVFSAEACEFWIKVQQRGDLRETGVEVSARGRRREALDRSFKRRRDHTLRDARLLKVMTREVGRRVLPELRRAFGAPDKRFEGFKLVCYDAQDGGHFKAHRDNLSPDTRHRRFALTLNLNDGYEGGALRFPEYGPQLHRPPAGGALLFGCHLLHEVTEVTQGQRYAVISFIYHDPRPVQS